MQTPLLRTAPFLVALSCSGTRAPVAEPIDLTGDTAVPIGDTDDGSETWADDVAPPDDVDADCWAWAVTMDLVGNEPQSAALRTFGPDTLSRLSVSGDDAAHAEGDEVQCEVCQKQELGGLTRLDVPGHTIRR